MKIAALLFIMPGGILFGSPNEDSWIKENYEPMLSSEEYWNLDDAKEMVKESHSILKDRNTSECEKKEAKATIKKYEKNGKIIFNGNSASSNTQEDLATQCSSDSEDGKTTSTIKGGTTTNHPIQNKNKKIETKDLSKYYDETWLQSYGFSHTSNNTDQTVWERSDMGLIFIKQGDLMTQIIVRTPLNPTEDMEYNNLILQHQAPNQSGLLVSKISFDGVKTVCNNFIQQKFDRGVWDELGSILAYQGSNDPSKTIESLAKDLINKGITQTNYQIFDKEIDGNHFLLFLNDSYGTLVIK